MDTPPSSQLTVSSWDEDVCAFCLAQPKPTYQPTCGNCGATIKWRRCKSTVKGNENQWMAVVSTCVLYSIRDPTKHTS
jgi:hypothetical protein